jgi:hypothetical protein
MSFRISSFIAAVTPGTSRGGGSKRSTAQERAARSGGAANLRTDPADVDAEPQRKPPRPSATEKPDPSRKSLPTSETD